jgi:hypothetical protein
MFLRFIGLSLLVPGVVSPLLPPGFAVPTAYGDLVAGILAIVATIALVNRTTWATTSVWLFNLPGNCGLPIRVLSGPTRRASTRMLRAAFFIVTARWYHPL